MDKKIQENLYGPINDDNLQKFDPNDVETKLSILSIEGGPENESSLDLERKVVEESPKGRFQRLEEELGAGSQKKVFLAYDTETGREVAWNSVIMDIKDEESIKKIKEEIQILKPLKHPNIISFIYCFYNDAKSEIVFITELFSGGSLSHYLMEFKFPRLRVVKLWCQEILKGLQYLHESKPPIIHRDIKCENIFVNRNTGEVKIGDLGLSIILKEDEYARQFCGTIEYCPPEVYNGKYGVKADIYSFGMSMIEMITGEKPYSECKGQILAVCDKVKNKIMPNCYKKIKNQRAIEFINKCLQPENERPSARELLQDPFLNDLDSEENNFPAINKPESKKRNSNNSINFKDKIKNDNFLEDLSSGEIKSIISYNIQNNKEDINSCKNDNSNISNVNDNISYNCDICNNKKNNNESKENNQNCIQTLIKNLNINQNEDKEKANINNNDIYNNNDLNNNKDNNLNQNDSNKNTEISFIIDKEEKSDPEICKIILIKKNGEKTTKFKFNYIFSIDTIQGVVNELAKVITFNNDEIMQCEAKLNLFIREQKQKLKEKQDIDEQINLINNCYELFTKEYNDNLKQIQDLTHLYQEIKKNSIDYTKEEIEDIDNKMKIILQLK